MSETSQNNPQEIDLIQVFSNIGKWIGEKLQWLVGIGLAIIYFFIRNVLWFIIAIAIGVISGLLTPKTASTFYHCELIGVSNTINSKEVIKLIDNWNYSKEFTPDELKLIKKIEATYILDYNKDRVWDKVEEAADKQTIDTAIMNKRLPGFFCVSIDIKDTTVLSDIREKLMNFISNNKRVALLNETRLEQVKELIPLYEKEIKDLDSLKYYQYFERNKPLEAKMGDALILETKESRLFHGDIINLTRQKMDLERSLIINSAPFEIVYDLSVPNSVQSDTRSIIISRVKKALVICFLLVLVYDKRRFFIQVYRDAREAANS